MARFRIRWLAATAVIASTLTAGCDGLLDVDVPGAVEPEVATGSATTLRSVLASAYDGLLTGNNLTGTSTITGGGYFGNIMLLNPELLADNAVPGFSGTSGLAINAQGSHLSQWNRYSSINDANFVIKFAPLLSDADEDTKARLEGEALFVRALHYFDLARIYGYEPGGEVNGWDRSVVLRLEPTEGLSDAVPKARSTVAEVWGQIEADLLRSIELLSAGGGSNIHLATAAGAEALLGRVYLYAARWSDAVTYSSAALQHTAARLATASEYPTMFHDPPYTESIFELDAAIPSLWHSNYAPVIALTPQGNLLSVAPSQELLDLHEPGDVRLSYYRVTDGQPYTTKWSGSRDGNLLDNPPVIRYSEVLLNRAEAYAELGEAALALADLNTLRAERGVGPVAGLAGQALINAILDERRREFAFEGHRWFDLKRRGMDIPKPASSGLPPLPYTDHRILAPLPNSQVQNNPLLVQNPGY